MFEMFEVGRDRHYVSNCSCNQTHTLHNTLTLHTQTLLTLALFVVPSFKSIWEGRENEAHKSPILNREGRDGGSERKEEGEERSDGTRDEGRVRNRKGILERYTEKVY